MAGEFVLTSQSATLVVLGLIATVSLGIAIAGILRNSDWWLIARGVSSCALARTRRFASRSTHVMGKIVRSPEANMRRQRAARHATDVMRARVGASPEHTSRLGSSPEHDHARRVMPRADTKTCLVFARGPRTNGGTPCE